MPSRSVHGSSFETRRPYVSVTLVGSVLAVHYQLLEVAMPLWVVEHTTAPRSLVAVLMVINTGVVIGKISGVEDWTFVTVTATTATFAGSWRMRASFGGRTEAESARAS